MSRRAADRHRTGRRDIIPTQATKGPILWLALAAATCVLGSTLPPARSIAEISDLPPPEPVASLTEPEGLDPKLWAQHAAKSVQAHWNCSWWAPLRFGWGIDYWQDAQGIEAISNLVIAQPALTSNYSKVVRYALGVGGDDDIRLMSLKTGNDDIAWYVLANLRACDAVQASTKKATSGGDPPPCEFYFRWALYAFSHTVEAWDSETCGVGVWWSGKGPTGRYKNAITNELFLTGAMMIHSRYPQRKFSSCIDCQGLTALDWAVKEFLWLNESGMIRSTTHLVSDGLDAACNPVDGPPATYNQGVLLSGLGLLYKETRNTGMSDIGRSALDLAVSIANATLFGKEFVDADGILREACEHDSGGSSCNPDERQFKGIFVRHLQYLLELEVLPEEEASRFRAAIYKNAVSAWTNSRDDPSGGAAYGYRWTGPFAAVTQADCDRWISPWGHCWGLSVASAVSALDLFNAAVATSRRRGVRKSTTGH